jgi:hypothetical protein
MNVQITTDCTVGSIPVLHSQCLQIPQIYYDSQTMTRIGTNPADPRQALVIPWTTTIGGPWPSPINLE